MKKAGENHFAYKNHVGVDAKHKLIRTFKATRGSGGRGGGGAVHDSRAIEDLPDKDSPNRDVYADSAIRSAEIKEKLEAEGDRDRIHRRAVRHKPLDERGQEANRRNSKGRCRIEHVFGDKRGSAATAAVR